VKVLIASRAPFVAGGEVAAQRLAVGLRDAGCEVALLLSDQGDAVRTLMERAELRCLQAPLHLTDMRHWWQYLRSRAAVRKIIIRERPDVLHANDFATHQVLAGAAQGLGIPTICHHRFFYDSAAIDWFNKFPADRHIFVSRALMDDMLPRSRSLGASSCAVVHDGLALPPPPSDEGRRRARIRLGLPADRAVVTFAGQIIECKGVHDLLRAWALLDDDVRRRAELVLIGEDFQGGGQYRARMQALAAELRCDARFVGFREDVGDWLLASDLAVVPSHVEPLGNATLEAMAYGLPVIGCAVGGIPEMIAHEQTGLLIAPHNPSQLSAALDRLLRDDATRQRFGVQGRERCETHFDIRLHIHKVIDQYRRVTRRYTPTPDPDSDLVPV